MIQKYGQSCYVESRSVLSGIDAPFQKNRRSIQQECMLRSSGMLVMLNKNTCSVHPEYLYDLSKNYTHCIKLA